MCQCEPRRDPSTSFPWPMTYVCGATEHPILMTGLHSGACYLPDLFDRAKGDQKIQFQCSVAYPPSPPRSITHSTPVVEDNWVLGTNPRRRIQDTLRGTRTKLSSVSSCCARFLRDLCVLVPLLYGLTAHGSASSVAPHGLDRRLGFCDLQADLVKLLLQGFLFILDFLNLLLEERA